MRRVEPVSFAAGSAAAASLVDTTTGMTTGAGDSAAATGVGSAECGEECKLAGPDVTGARMNFGSASPVQDSAALSVASVVGSGISDSRGLGAASAAGSDILVIGITDGKSIGALARDCFGGIAGTAVVCMDGIMGGAGVFRLSRGESTLPVVASVSCRSLITSRSFPLFLSALPVLPAPESTSSWAKLSMLSRILSSSAPSSSSPTKDSLFSLCGRVRLWGAVEVGPFMVRWLFGFWTWNWAILC